MSQNLLCPRCDTPNTPGSRFCIECATRLTPSENIPSYATPTLAAPATASEPAQRCGSCGRANPAVARFCVTCGASLVAAPVGYAGVPAFAGGGYAVAQPIYAYAPTAELPLIVRALWFFFVGLTGGLIWLGIAWLLNLTLIGLPLGLWMLSMMPQVMTLKQGRPAPRTSLPTSAASIAVRAVYFLLIGWWLSLVWMLLAWVVAATVIGLPLAFLMFERTGAVLTLADV